MEEKEHLPLYGVGPLCVASMVVLLIAAILLRYFGCLESGQIEALRVPFLVLGSILIGLGVFIWIQAVIVSKIDSAILENHLVTSGIYLWVRNPIYSAIAMALTGAALLFGNIWFLVLPFLYWLDITFLMKATEEKWLAQCYGQAYLDYCKQVNRCIPWFPKTKQGK